MLRYFFLLCGSCLFVACATPTSDKISATKVPQAEMSTKVTLSHVQAYLLLGNVAKAEERFATLPKPEQLPEAMLTLAELRAAKGDDVGAEQAFVLASQNPELNKQLISTDMLDYFCQSKKWQTLQLYMDSLTASTISTTIKNHQIANTALCFFDNKQWPVAQQLLNQLDFSLPVNPQAYLALARIHVEQKHFMDAKKFMDKFEANRVSIDAASLSTSYEVYSALQQPALAKQSAQQLVSLFPESDYYIIYKTMLAFDKSAPEPIVDDGQVRKVDVKKQPKIHLIQKGETLYQLSKRYGVTVDTLIKWNPTLVIDDIALNTPIQVSP